VFYNIIEQNIRDKIVSNCKNSIYLDLILKNQAINTKRQLILSNKLFVFCKFIV